MRLKSRVSHPQIRARDECEAHAASTIRGFGLCGRQPAANSTKICSPWGVPAGRCCHPCAMHSHIHIYKLLNLSYDNPGLLSKDLTNACFTCSRIKFRHSRLLWLSRSFSAKGLGLRLGTCTHNCDGWPQISSTFSSHSFVLVKSIHLRQFIPVIPLPWLRFANSTGIAWNHSSQLPRGAMW